MNPRGFVATVIICVLIGTAVFSLRYFECVSAGRCLRGADFAVIYTAAGKLPGNSREVYSAADLSEFMEHKPGESKTIHPFLYPPYALFLTAPFGLTGFSWGLILFYLLQITALLALAACREVRQRFTVWKNGSEAFPYVEAAFLLPFIIYSLAAGQVGLLTSVLLVAGLVYRDKKPKLAGMLFAILTFKPQLAVMVPVLLLAERRFEVIGSMVAGVAVISALSLVILGAEVWYAYFAAMEEFSRLIATLPRQLALQMISLYGAVTTILQSHMAGLIIHGSLAAFLLIFIYERLRDLTDENEKLLLALAGTLLISPYFFVYDSVVAGFAILLLVRRGIERGSFLPLERIVIIIMPLMPVAANQFANLGIPLGFIASAVLCWAVLTGHEKSCREVVV